MSWLSSALKKTHFKLDGHSAGNLLKNLSPIASFIPGLGIPVTAALAAGGEALRGKTKLSDMLKAASSNAAIGGGARTAYQGLQGLAGNLGGGGAASAPVGMPPASASVAQSGLPSNAELIASRSAPRIAPTIAQAGQSAIRSAAGAVPGGSPSPLSALSKIKQGASAIGSFADKHSGGLQLAGQVAGGVLEARGQDAQTGIAQQQLDFQKQQYSDQEKRRARLAELLAPLLQQPASRGY